MIKLKDLLYEMNLLIPRKVEGRVEKYIQLKIKEYIKNNNVGDFNISRLGLTKLPASLKHLKIGGNFYCSTNKLTSLAGAPTSIGLDFNCSDNDLDTLAGAPTSVGGNFFCYDNILKSLAGAPSSVGLDFHCYDNSVKFTEKQVRAVCDVKGTVSCV